MVIFFSKQGKFGVLQEVHFHQDKGVNAGKMMDESPCRICIVYYDRPIWILYTLDAITINRFPSVSHIMSWCAFRPPKKVPLCMYELCWACPGSRGKSLQNYRHFAKVHPNFQAQSSTMQNKAKENRASIIQKGYDENLWQQLSAELRLTFHFPLSALS